MIILHITQKSEWEKQTGDSAYWVQSLDELGYLHCAKPIDVVDAANCYYRGMCDMVLLCIDLGRVIPKISWAKSEYGVDYPHIHGKLNRDAVVEVLDFATDADGWFIFPEELNKYMTPN